MSITFFGGLQQNYVYFRVDEIYMHPAIIQRRYTQPWFACRGTVLKAK
jgi:hypothetical protein